MSHASPIQRRLRRMQLVRDDDSSGSKQWKRFQCIQMRPARARWRRSAVPIFTRAAVAVIVDRPGGQHPRIAAAAPPTARTSKQLVIWFLLANDIVDMTDGQRYAIGPQSGNRI